MVGGIQVVVKRKKGVENILEVSIGDENVFIVLEEDLTVNDSLLKKIKKDYDISILSGDNLEKVETLAKKIGIDHALGDQTPEDKLKYVKRMQESEGVIFIGDGINDSPSLQQGGLEKILNIRNLATKSSKRVRQNLFLAFIYNTLMIPVAVSGNISPKLGALAMAMSSISVVVNSSRKLTN